MQGRSILLLALGALLVQACGKHQYLAVPRANTQEKRSGGTSTPAQHPTATVVTGNLALAAGQSVTVHVDWSTVTELDPKQLMLLALDPAGLFFRYWTLELTAQELAARSADLEFFSFADPPTKEWCQKDARGLGSCAGEVDEGVTGVTIVPTNDSAIGWPGTTISLKVPALKGGDQTCGGFTKADCCAGSPGISAISCNLDSACLCPEGTTISGGPHADGTVTCMCH